MGVLCLPGRDHGEAFLDISLNTEVQPDTGGFLPKFTDIRPFYLTQIPISYARYLFL